MKIGDIVDFQNGYAFKSADFITNGKYKVIKIKELKDGEIRFFDDSASINIDDLDNMEKYLVKNGDVLFALTGDPVSKSNPLSWVGRVSLYKQDEMAVLNQRVCKMIIKDKNQVNAKYLYYHFRIFENFYSLAAKATGSASQANISVKTIADEEINLPTIEVQNSVVSIIDALSLKIDLNSNINKNLAA